MSGISLSKRRHEGIGWGENLFQTVAHPRAVPGAVLGRLGGGPDAESAPLRGAVSSHLFLSVHSSGPLWPTQGWHNVLHIPPKSAFPLP